MTLFAGRGEWLGHRWVLGHGMPRHDMPTRSCAIGAAHLTMANGGGMMIENTSRRWLHESRLATSSIPHVRPASRVVMGFAGCPVLARSFCARLGFHEPQSFGNLISWGASC